jgi:hypothetical protein
MKLNDITYTFSLAVLVLTGLHALLYSGLAGLLFSAAVALIAAAFIDQFEVIVGITILFSLTYTLFLKRWLRKWEPFANPKDSQSIVQRIEKMKKGLSPYDSIEPMGVYDKSVEGFQDLQPELPKEGASQESSSASAKQTVNQVNEKEATDVANTIEEKKKSDTEIEKEEFQSATNQLFKLGKLPSENDAGPKLDPGQTLMKAMNSLDPNVISSMTADTKKLLETQKSLMGMLGQMRPILADGKELLQTFSGMFGGKI